LRVSERPGPAYQDEESRLERILGVVRVGEYAPADGEDHWPVAAQELLESALIAQPVEPIEQLPVRGFDSGRRLGRIGTARATGKRSVFHLMFSGVVAVLTIILPSALGANESFAFFYSRWPPADGHMPWRDLRFWEDFTKNQFLPK
jgi:hypothetical protein